jgi:hypothetical protein
MVNIINLKKKVGLCEILEKFGTNAYRVKLPDNLHISNTFNVSHLHKYFEEDASLRSSFDQSGKPNVVCTEEATNSYSDIKNGHTKSKLMKNFICTT